MDYLKKVSQNTNDSEQVEQLQGVSLISLNSVRKQFVKICVICGKKIVASNQKKSTSCKTDAFDID